MKVLIIDDEPLVRRSLHRAMQSRGHEVLEAEDGEQGLKVWKSMDPDLIFLDVLMPGKTGPQLLQEMGRTRAKVILMSAYSGDHNIETATKMGADLFIPKPFEDIFAIVQKAEEMLA